MRIEFEFCIGQDVKIVRSGVVGVVRSAYVDRHTHHSFRVEYTDEAKVVQEEWFEAEDLQAAEPKDDES